MDFEDKKEKSLTDYITLFNTSFLRYWRLSIGPALVILILTSLLGFLLKNYYKSDFLVYIEPQKFQTSLFESTDPEEMTERMNGLMQGILSRRRVRKIIKKFKLYPSYDSSPEGQQLAVKAFHKDITIDPVKSVVGKDEIDLAYRITYTHNKPKIARDVAKEISNLFIDESMVADLSQIKGETTFLESQLEDARKKLLDMEAKRKEFIKENYETLPTNQIASIARLESAQSQLGINNNLIETTLARKENLQREYQQQKKYVSPQTLGNSSLQQDPLNPRDSLAQLEAALLVLESRYSTKHPDVINTKKRITALKRQISAGGGEKSSTGEPVFGESTSARSVRLQIEEASIRVLELEKQNTLLKSTVVDLEADIRQMPLKEHELIKINRDYDNVKETYQQLLTARQNAGLRESLIQGKKASQFKIIEEAELPTMPSGPNRLVPYAAAIFGSLGTLFAVPFLFSFFNSSFKFSKEVENELDLEIIGVVPPLDTPEILSLRKKRNALSATASLAVLTLGTSALFVLL